MSSMVAWLRVSVTQGSVALLLHNGRKWWQRYGNQEDPEKAFARYNVSKHFCGTSCSKPYKDRSWQLTGFLLDGEYWHQTPSFARKQLREQATIVLSVADVLQSSQGWHRKKDQLEFLRDLIGWERCFSTWSGALPIFHIPSPSCHLCIPSSSPAWGLHVLRDTAQVNSFPAWWQARTSACKQLNLYAPLQPLQSALSRPWSPTTATRRSSNQ